MININVALEYEYKLFESIEQCAIDFASNYLPLTVNVFNKEICSYIYEQFQSKGFTNGRSVKEVIGYFYTRPIIGMHSNCILPAMYNSIGIKRYHNSLRIAFIHTHPRCKCHLPDVFSWGDKHIHIIEPSIKYIYLCAPTSIPKLLRLSVGNDIPDKEIVLDSADFKTGSR